jgi:hypothetical protein
LGDLLLEAVGTKYAAGALESELEPPPPSPPQSTQRKVLLIPEMPNSAGNRHKFLKNMQIF